MQTAKPAARPNVVEEELDLMSKKSSEMKKQTNKQTENDMTKFDPSFLKF